MSHKLNHAKIITKGDVFLVNPLEILAECRDCKTFFLHSYSVNYTIACQKCGKPISADRVQRGERPVIVIQDPSYIDATRTATAIPLTTSNQRFADQYPGVTVINKNPNLKLPKDDLFSFALVYQIHTVNRNSLIEEKRCGKISNSDLSQIDKKIKLLFRL